MKLTTYFRLKKPEGADVVNVDDFNDNFDTIDSALHDAADAAGDASQSYVFASAAANRTNIESGDTFAILVGKIMKWFNDLKDGAFSTVANNDTTTSSGYVADARIVKTHGDEIDNARTRIAALEQSFPDGCNTIYNGAVAAGVTPSAKTPSALAAAYNAVKNLWIHNDRQGDATAADVRAGKTFTNSSTVNDSGTMPDLSASNFSGAFTSETPGASASYQVKATTNGYVANNTQVKSVAAATSPEIDTTGETGVKTINIKPGVYNKIKVDQTPAYDAGHAEGVADGAGMAVGIFQDSGSSMPRTVTKTLPAGNYCLSVVQATWAGANSVTLTIGGTSTTYQIGASGFGKTYKDANNSWLGLGYGLKNFTLSGDTSVTLAVTNNGNTLNYVLASIYPASLY